MTISAEMRRSGTVSTWTKPAARMPPGLGGQELLPGRAAAAGGGVDPGAAQDVAPRGGWDRGPEPGKLTLSPPVPHLGLSVAMRMTSLRIAAAVGGRPGRRRL